MNEEAIVNNVAEDADLDAEMESAIAEAQGEQPRPVLPHSIGEDYLKNGGWDADQKEFQGNKPISTGFPWWDSEQPLYQGFYVLGAIASLGKTSMVWNISQSAAENCVTVLYFSFEQTPLELYSKALSRRIFENKSNQHVYTAIEIRQGKANGTSELTQELDAFAKDVGDRLHVIECDMYTTVEHIMDEISTFIEETQTKPLVIIDYLQIIYPTAVNGRIPTDARMNIDHIVKSLKQFQKENGLVLMAICSLNRANYMTPVDFESFRESSSIEYTADVVLGLNLALILDKDFETKTSGKGTKDTTVTDKRLMVMKAKEAPIRDIVLKAVKNRFGRASFSMYFEYEPAYETFRQGSPVAFAARKAQLEKEVAKEMNNS